MNRIIAIPLENGVLSEHFGHCSSFAIIEVVNDMVLNTREAVPPEHQPGLYPRWVSGLGVTDVIAGGIGQKAIELFNQFNINVFAGAPVKNASDLVQDFLSGKLNLSENYCNH